MTQNYRLKNIGLIDKNHKISFIFKVSALVIANGILNINIRLNEIIIFLKQLNMCIF